VKTLHTLVASAALAALSVTAISAQEAPEGPAPTVLDEEVTETSAIAGASQESAAVAKEEEDPDRIVCEKKKRTGTRIPRRTCLTVAQWERIREENREVLDRVGGAAGAGGFGANPTPTDPFGGGG